MGTIRLPKWVAIFSFTKPVTRNYPKLPEPRMVRLWFILSLFRTEPEPNRNPLGLGADRPKPEPIRPIAIPILNLIDPFHRYVGKDMMGDLKYPLKDNTIPPWAVPIYAILLPIAIFLFFYFRRRDVYDLHHAVLGLLYSVFITAVITSSLKDAVGRPRPDFFWRCFPDGKEVYDRWGDVICHSENNVVKEGYKSFPSGHTSGSFAGLGFLSLYLSGKIKSFDRRGHVAKLCIVFLPLLIASLVGISRVDDYWHHWEDVFAGGLLGLTVATFCYLQFFPPPYHVEGWGPYAYFRMLEGLRTSAQAANNVHVQNEQPTEAHMESQRHERNSNAFIGISLAGDSSSTPEDLESGRSANRTSEAPRIAGDV